MNKANSQKDANDIMEIKYDKDKATIWTAALINECNEQLVKLGNP